MKLLQLFEAIDAGAVGDIQAALRQRYGVHLDLRMGRDGIVDLEGIQAPKDAPPGTGTAAMEDLVRWADQNGVMLTLQFGEKGYEPVKGWKKTSSQARLKKFYARFGFRPNKGRYKRFDLSLYTSMYREPRKAMNELVNVNTPAFRQWFGNSKVVDEQGRPQMVFHGTATEAEFDKLAGVSHFGTLKAAQSRIEKTGGAINQQQRIFPVYLRITNPATLRDSGNQHYAYVLINDLVAGMRDEDPRLADDLMDLQNEWVQDMMMTWAEDHPDLDEWGLQQIVHEIFTQGQNAGDHIMTQAVIDMLKYHGYDGIHYINAYESLESDSWVTFNQSQVKYAYAESVTEAKFPNWVGWTNIKTGETVSGTEPHYTYLRQHAEKMGIPPNKALDSYHGPSQMAAYEQGWMRWFFWDQGHWGSELYLSGTKQLLDQPAAKRLAHKLIQKWQPDHVNMDLIDRYGRVEGLNDPIKGTDRAALRKWFDAVERFESGEDTRLYDPDLADD